MRMRLVGVLGEVRRSITSGTTHACAFAVALAAVIGLLCGADMLTISRIQAQVDNYVAAGGSTYVINYAGRIDPVACESLASLQGVRAAGALRQADSKITFATLPATGVPSYEVTEGAIALFSDSTGGATDGVASIVSDISDALDSGIWLSSEAAEPLHASAGETVPLNDGRQASIGGVYDWPDDGRKSGYSYAVLEPVPADRAERFDSCWVKAWPVPSNIESLLQLATVGDSATGQERPVVSQLNTSHGTELDAVALYHQRLTIWVPVVALAAGLLLGVIAIRMRRLECASALHCGVPKKALVTQLMLETGLWLVVAVLLASPLLAWTWLNNPNNADAWALTDTVLRVPVAAAIGGLVGALFTAVMIREQHLFRYFKNR
ncbi:hypothetical protein G1C95_2051 [Bifidobacterium sp. DSM 109957]|uniref:ABC transporter permease n=2 Tax=Bifidobacterium oedipodis TaxID=2675322 RepID=A0A7Y0HTR6_9BIFI|nr:hypothetical protein [Bifidobacterium sp. DSM 109957]